MRPGPGKRHIRGRNNRGGGGKGGGNPMHRGFESNGPDVKIRGTAQHIAEKYAQLGRDAQASGDHVLAENYLQHAEHYYRMIAAYQAQFAPPGEEGDGEGAEGADSAEIDGNDEQDDGGRGFRPEFRNHRQDHRQDHRHDHRQDYRGDYRNDRFSRRGNNNGRPEETEQPAVAFPQREEQGAEGRGDHRGPRRFDNKRERFPRDRNPAAPPQGESQGSDAEALPSFLTRTRRRGRNEEQDKAEGADNNNHSVPPATEA